MNDLKFPIHRGLDPQEFMKQMQNLNEHNAGLELPYKLLPNGKRVADATRAEIDEATDLHRYAAQIAAKHAAGLTWYRLARN